MFYWICGVGSNAVPPVIIHQGGTQTEFPAKFTYDLPDDWFVHSTPHGYMDKYGFNICMNSLASNILKRDGNNEQPQFVFIDGYEAHFSNSALESAKAANIHVFILKGNDSINDQPADMGANAILEKNYEL